MEKIGIRQARRIALAAQGFLPSERGRKRPDRRHVDAAIGAMQLLQIDSVNVLERSHYLPLFARLGDYRKNLIDDAVHGPPRKRGYFEYWAHEASILPLDIQPLLRWRMAEARKGVGMWKGLHRFSQEKAGFVQRVLDNVRAEGPLRVADIEDGGESRGPWWGWKDAKIAMEWLFWIGEVTAATRVNFERRYDVPERVLPAEILAAPTPSAEDAHRALLRQSAASLGIATEMDLRDYFRLSPAQARPRIAELQEAGDLIPTEVEGWDRPAWLWRDHVRPSRATCRALLSPFDPLVWFRPRGERLFDFIYRIEIYTPKEKRRYGYYVLPFLMGDRIAARVDLKSDRAASRLLVRAAWSEPGSKVSATVEALAEELQLMASWLGLDEVHIEDKGDLARPLSGEVASRHR